MPTTYIDQFWILDPAYPPAAGTALNVESFELIDNDSDGDIGRRGGDSVDGSDVSRSYVGDTVTVQYPDGSVVTVTGTTFYLADGREVFTPTDGSILQDAVLVGSSYVTSSSDMAVSDLGPTCFVAGTRISTPNGSIAVESLKVDDVVKGYDGRNLRLKAILSTQKSRFAQRKNEKLRPVRIVTGALGAGLPVRDLRVSRQHRMLVRSHIAQRLFSVPEVLVSAIKLTALPGIYLEPADNDVEYFHLVFDQHEVILAEGAATESLFVGAGALELLSAEARQELLLLFPELQASQAPQVPARKMPTGKAVKRLVQKHLKNSCDPFLG